VILGREKAEKEEGKERVLGKSVSYVFVKWVAERGSHIFYFIFK